MNRYFILAFLLSIRAALYAQPPAHTFTLNGSINIDTGIIKLCTIDRGSSYPFKGTMETKVINGKFTFTDSINYPTAYLIFCIRGSDTDNAYASSTFFVVPGVQDIACNMDSLREVPKIDNCVMTEYKENFSKKYRASHKVPDKLSRAAIIPFDNLFDNTLLLNYTEENPDSYMALWWLIYRHSQYDSIFQTVYSKLSDSLKATYAGLNLAKDLRVSRNVSVGKVFPQLSLQDSNMTYVIIPDLNIKNKYTLVDLWYTRCGPCMAQIPKFKKLYDLYKQNRFEIIGISVDREEDLQHWKYIIATRQWEWPQYWDKNAKNATDILGVGGYPYNFLLNQNGIIIKRNIRPEELAKMLAE